MDMSDEKSNDDFWWTHSHSRPQLTHTFTYTFPAFTKPTFTWNQPTKPTMIENPSWIWMDIIVPLIILFIIFAIVVTCCGICCKKNKQGIVYGQPNAAIVTSTTTYTQGTNAPYPIDTPVQPPGVQPPGFNINQAPYPAAQPPYPAQPYPPAPYPTSTPYPAATSMPMPPAQYTSPVPPYPAQPPPSQQLPPSYAEAVTQPPTNEVYAKQAPYNPNY